MSTSAPTMGLMTFLVVMWGAALAWGGEPPPLSDQPPATLDAPDRTFRTLTLTIETDASGFDVHGHDLGWVVLRRHIEAPGGGALQSGRLSMRRPTGAKGKVVITAELATVIRGHLPSVHARVFHGSWCRVRLSAGRQTLGQTRWQTGANEPPPPTRHLHVQVPLESLWRVKPRPRVRHAKRALAFYYGWYGRADGPTGRWRHWRPKRADKGVKREPLLGYYDSLHPRVIEQHLNWAKSAGIDGFILSWWGRSRRSDRLLRALLKGCAARGLFLSLYIEDARGASSLRERLVALKRDFMKHPGWLRHRGRPVVFFYGRVHKRIGRWQLAKAVSKLGLFTHVDSLDLSDLQRFDALHAYYTHTHPERYVGGLDNLRLGARARGRLVTATVSPGYDDRLTRRPSFVRPRAGGLTYRDDQAVAAGADWVLITSWNEWHEDSQIEPSTTLNELSDTALWLRAWRRR